MHDGRFLSMKKKGFSLMLAILCGIILISLLLSANLILSSEFKNRKSFQEKSKAKYLAESGIEHGIYKFCVELNGKEKKDTGYNIKVKLISNTKIDNVGSYDVEYSQISGDLVLIYSNGIAKNNNVKLKVQYDIKNKKILSWDYY